jgi:predicted phosphoribosyltransferase
MSISELRDAGRRLANSFVGLTRQSALVLAIPRRGAVVAHQVARRLQLPMDLVLATKVTAPGRHAPTLGAVALGGVVVPDLIPSSATRLSVDERNRLLGRALAALDDRLAALRGDAPLPDLRDRIVLLVDDAAISGLTLQAAATAVAAREPARLIIATPMCSLEAEVRLREECDELVTLELASTVRAAERHALATAALQIDDDEVRELVADAQRASGGDLYQGLEIDG